LIVRDFDDMRIGTTPLSKLYYGHDLIWKRKDEGDSDILIITTVSTYYFQIPSINVTYGISGTADMGDGKVFQYNNFPIYYEYNYPNNWEIKIDAPFTAIRDSAFTGDYTKNLIKEIVIPKGVTSIGKSAFASCYFLESITLPNTLETIGDYAFYNCGSVASSNYNRPIIFNFGKSIRTIGNYAFAQCALGNFILPNTLTSIGNFAFQLCTQITSVTIPKSVVNLGRNVFQNCSKLNTVVLNNLPNEIREGMFYNCSSLTSITIPDSVTIIEQEAFYNCSSLTSITIPDSVTTIEQYAFGSCRSLTSIKIPDLVTTIEQYTFYNCRSLTSITIPPSVKSIGTSAFANTALTSVTIAEDCTYASNSFPPNCVINRY
jgi:hypothetical protein